MTEVAEAGASAKVGTCCDKDEPHNLLMAEVRTATGADSQRTNGQPAAMQARQGHAATNAAWHGDVEFTKSLAKAESSLPRHMPARTKKNKTEKTNGNEGRNTSSAQERIKAWADKPSPEKIPTHKKKT